jgi:DNA-binding MarR family transcriptional regulator
MTMAGDGSVSDIEAHLGYWLRTVSNAVSQGFARSVEAEGVTVAEWVFLRMLYDVESIAPSQLAERMGMTKGAISKLADRLVEKDLVVREANADGRRGQTLMLKPAARQLVPRLAALADRNDATFFGALAPEERTQLERMLRRIARERELSDIPTA